MCKQKENNTTNNSKQSVNESVMGICIPGKKKKLVRGCKGFIVVAASCCWDVFFYRDARQSQCESWKGL